MYVEGLKETLFCSLSVYMKMYRKRICNYVRRRNQFMGLEQGYSVPRRNKYGNLDLQIGSVSNFRQKCIYVESRGI
jgi:hypothetical protein